MTYFQITRLIMLYAIVIFIICLITLRCKSVEGVVEYDTPVGVEKQPDVVGGLPENCPYPFIRDGIYITKEEMLRFHGRCKAVYGRKDYCVVRYTKKYRKDGSYHINIICGIPPKEEWK